MNNEHQQDEHQQALDYIAIQRVMSNYCKASDEGIEELMRSVYHEDAYDDHAGMFSGPASEFVDFAMTQSHTLTLRVCGLRNDAKPHAYIAIASLDNHARRFYEFYSGAGQNQCRICGMR
ncbi:MAG: nuclear transport factor 2 family protein [Gammaproteobacteria bacterium]|nr:nuclear transport factor 2 family protein [Gammaproteobacteria bacterium]